MSIENLILDNPAELTSSVALSQSLFAFKIDANIFALKLIGSMSACFVVSTGIVTRLDAILAYPMTILVSPFSVKIVNVSASDKALLPLVNVLMKYGSTLIPNSNESGRFLSSGGVGITYKSLNIYFDFVFLFVSSNSIEINLSPD